VLIIENGLYFDGQGSAPVVRNILVKDGAVALYFNGGAKISTQTDGGETEGQHRATAAAPVGASDLARKDYVDGLIADLQTQIDNIINGTTAFTGVVNGVDFIANG